MIESDISSIMSGIIRNSGQNHRPSPQEYRHVVTANEEVLRRDAQLLLWLSIVKVSRIEQMASDHMNLGDPSAPQPHPVCRAGTGGVHQGRLPGRRDPGLVAWDPSVPTCLTSGPSCLIAMALKNSKTGSLPVSEIYSFMKEHFPYFKTAPDGWKNSVRHNLSLNKCFEKVENKMSGSSRKGCLWALNLARIDKMEEEMHKWKRKDLAIYSRWVLSDLSLLPAEELDKLISDRPESCRRPGKLGEPEASVLTHSATVAMAHGCLAVSQLPPQPLMTLSLQSVPLHHQAQPQAHLAPDSPAPAQTPPLHALPDHSPSPLPHPAMGRAPVDFINISTDMNPEVDTLDPSIMDFALQGNLWEEMKDEGFSLDALGAFGDSPLDCDLGGPGLTPVSGGNNQSFSDLQVTGLYATYSTPDSVATSATASSSPYLGAPGNKNPLGPPKLD
nr:forkhead box protein N4 [Loxodonta africana]